jgi:stage II sporulation protein AA (anti-sigma F factor antagonist)
MQIETVLKKRVLIFYLIGELDESAAEYAKKRIDLKLDGGDFDCVVFDFSRLVFMDSTGIGILIGRYKKLARRGIKLYIQNTSVQVEKVLRMSGIYDIIPKLANSEVI